MKSLLKSSSNPEFRLGKISFLKAKSEVIGEGSFGTVVLRGRYESRPVAIKKIFIGASHTSKSEESSVNKEIANLLQCDNHENVLKYFGREPPPGKEGDVLYVALELCTCSLHDFIVKNEKGSKLPSDVPPVELLKQMGRGVHHLHSRRIVHRDLKPENILLLFDKPTGRTVVKIADFGISKKLGSVGGHTEVTRNCTGTLGWMAPEIRSESVFSLKSDIFSLGCVFHYVLSDGLHPFGDESEDGGLQRLIHIKNGAFQTTCASLGEHQGSWNLICGMIASQREARPPIDEILRHHIFWSKERKLHFLVAVSNAAEDRQDEAVKRCSAKLEESYSLVVGEDDIGREAWRDKVDEAVSRVFSPKFKKGLMQLLRELRNRHNHYSTAPPEVKEALGSLPNAFFDFWDFRFPHLFNSVWESFEELKMEEKWGLTSFYEKSTTVNHTYEDDTTSINSETQLALPPRPQITRELLGPSSSTVNLKCVLVGDSSTEKTKMLISYTSHAYPDEYVPTVFDNYSVNLQVDGIPVNLGIWDTSGQEDYTRLRPLSYANTDIFILCFCIVDPDSFDSVRDKWNPEVEQFSPGIPKILVGTHLELRNDPETVATLKRDGKRAISTSNGVLLQKKIGAKKYFECSAVTHQGLQTVFDEAALTVFETRLEGVDSVKGQSCGVS